VVAQGDRGGLHHHVVEARGRVSHFLQTLAQLDRRGHVDLCDELEVRRGRLRFRHAACHGLLEASELVVLHFALGARLATLGCRGRLRLALAAVLRRGLDVGLDDPPTGA
jgi:hypothetical protein